jgi:hypothetical protein
MAELVQSLINDHGCSREEVAAGIGADPGEVDLLYENSIFKARSLADAPYSRAWYPAETGKAATLTSRKAARASR